MDLKFWGVEILNKKGICTNLPDFVNFAGFCDFGLGVGFFNQKGIC
jgi:hypothetical protein